MYVRVWCDGVGKREVEKAIKVYTRVWCDGRAKGETCEVFECTECDALKLFELVTRINGDGR